MVLLRAYRKRVTEHIRFRLRQLKRCYQQKFVIPTYEEKRRIIKEYANEFKTNCFIETGTFLGDTVEALKHDFETIVSIELQPNLAQKAKQRFGHESGIAIIEGDSGKLLSGIIQDFREHTLFWLDGHYSSEFSYGTEKIITAKGDKNTPVLEELDAILKNGLDNNVILIDDARCFGTEPDYPGKSELYTFLSRKGIDHDQIKISRDIIRITPA